MNATATIAGGWGVSVSKAEDGWRFKAWRYGHGSTWGTRETEDEAWAAANAWLDGVR